MKIPRYFYLSLAILWLYSGIVPIAFNQADSLTMLHRMHIGQGVDWALFILASLIDAAYGVLILTRWRYQPLLWLAQFVTVASYSVLIAVFLPENFTHPFAPLIKNLPILAMLWFLFQFHRKN